MARGRERLVAERQARRERRGVRAARAVGGAVGVALARQLGERRAVEEQVRRAGAVAAGDDDVRRARARAAPARARSRRASSSPASTRASARFGVMTVARGRICSRSASTASAASRRAPDSATITGSWTTGVPGGSSSSAAATVSIVAMSPSIPIFTASTPRSSATARTCAAMISGATGCTALTPTVFCTVIAVIAVVPCTPARANALRSAWIPAPPPESEPAIERATGTRRRARREDTAALRDRRLARRPTGARATAGSRAADIAPSRAAPQEAEQLELGEPGHRRLRLGGRRRERADRVAAVLDAPQQRAQRRVELVGARGRASAVATPIPSASSSASWAWRMTSAPSRSSALEPARARRRPPARARRRPRGRGPARARR